MRRRADYFPGSTPEGIAMAFAGAVVAMAIAGLIRDLTLPRMAASR